LEEALRQCVCLDLGLNFIDTRFYGRGMSEVLLGVALRDVAPGLYLWHKLADMMPITSISPPRVVESMI